MLIPGDAAATPLCMLGEQEDMTRLFRGCFCKQH